MPVLVRKSLFYGIFQQVEKRVIPPGIFSSPEEAGQSPRETPILPKERGLYPGEMVCVPGEIARNPLEIV
jgi:hypothetical protein